MAYYDIFSNINKGFDTYKLIDEMLVSEQWKNKIDFTYIGNPSKDINLLNTRLIEPLSGTQLANEIKKHHIYVTGSINEPSGNHHIEAVQCGLPVLFKKSGGIPEYCESFGVEFEEDFIEKLNEDFLVSRSFLDYMSNILTTDLNGISLIK